jgi:hypothetical protein
LGRYRPAACGKREIDACDYKYAASSIKVNWSSVTASDLPITGYVLEMDDGLGGPFVKTYDGKENTQLLSFEVFNLEP